MKTKIFSIVTILFLSLTVSAQIDRTQQPKPGPAPKINLGTPKKFALPNGLQVLVVENHKLPRVSATLTIDNPPMSFGNKKGVEGLLSGMLGTGSTNTPKAKFDEEVDFLGANISFWDEGARASSLSKYFPKVLTLMADAAFNPVFTQEEFDKQMKQSLDGIKNSAKSVKAIASRVEDALTYGKNHPFGEFTSEETLKNVTLQDVKDLYNKTYKPNNAYLIIIGDVNFNEIKSQVKDLFGTWKKGDLVAQKLPKVENPSTTEINFIDMPNAVQSELSIINAVDLKMNDKDYYAALLANQILGGGGTGRLYKNLREDKGYTYGAYSGIGSSRYASRFKTTASVRNMVTDSAMVEAMKEINKIRYQKATQEELDIAKAKYIGNFVRNVEKPQTVASYALNILTNNLPADYYKNYLKNINAVTLDDVQNAAIKYFKGDKARIIITGKGIDVLKNLEKTADYKINYFDTNGNPIEKPAMKKEVPAGVTKETVINKYFEAIGGADKLKALKTTMVVYGAEMQGMKVETTEKRNATHFSATTAMNGNTMMKVIMDKNAVKMNGQALPPKMANEMASVLGTVPEFGFLNSSDFKLTGIESIEGNDVYVISKKGEIVSVSSYYDVNSGLKIKEVKIINMGGRTNNQEAVFSDYKDFNGVKFPSKKTASMGPQKVQFTLKDAKVNEGVSDADFK
ncbi:M16 family metallopeptidase [Tenacibaculum singaporense]|uniref:M16 family metallopeptidase n=1 Tax=Tenacibaculum singaporense TaxID=2358479 RepID=UPI000F66A1EE|nr:pitrilysin family protein [Tenacibaculum singaporense]RSC94906.1 insulinase family protein [Tenacibaculum singaporense]